MRYWSMVLHFYQPPTQDLSITKSILNSCYLPLLRLLSQKTGFGLTINLGGSLLLQLQQLEAIEFFDLINKLLVDKKIEILNSVVYHPLIPITPSDIVTRQITKNQQLLNHLFGVKPPKGFFPPELAIDINSLGLINSQYLIIDQTSLKLKTSIAKFGNKYLLVNNRPVCDLLRAYPRELLVSIITDLFHENCDDNQLLVTANDAELFGHHYTERLQTLSDLLDSKNIKFITASAAISCFKKKSISVANLLPSTWQNCQNFSLWNKNNLQKKYLTLLKNSYDLTKGNLNNEAEDYLDKSYASCHPYWLSNWPWWHPDLVQAGAVNSITSVRMSTIDGPKKANMEIIYHEFLSQMWQYHWSGKVEENYKKFDQTTNKFLGV